MQEICKSRKGLNPGDLAITADGARSDRTHVDWGAVGGEEREALAVRRAGDATRRTPGVVGLATTVAVALTVAVSSLTLRTRSASGRTEAGLRSSGTKGHGMLLLIAVVALVVEDRAGHGSVGVVGRVAVVAGRRLGGVGTRGSARARVGSEEVGVAVALVTLALDGALDGGAGLGEVDVLALDGLALGRAVDVGDEDGRQAVEALSVGRVSGGVVGLKVVVVISVVVHLATLAAALAANVDLGTVHVHFTVADLVEPAPGKQSLTRGSVRRDSELVLLVDGAATKDGVDNLEGLALVVRQGDLARTALVSGTTSELQRVAAARLVIGSRIERVVRVALARKVRAISRQWVGVRVVLLAIVVLVEGTANGEGLAHLHVSRDRRGQETRCEEEILHNEESFEGCFGLKES